MNETSQADRFAPLFAELDRRLAGEALVRLAIEGGSASGKTTLGKILAERYDCTVFHMDDFFSALSSAPPHGLPSPAGRIGNGFSPSATPAPARRKGFYRRFDCASMQLQNAVETAPKKLVVAEGAYSMHPDLAPYYDLSIFLDISPELQRERISRRNTPEKANRFFAEWIPMEQAYFAAFDIPAKCTLRLPIL